MNFSIVHCMLRRNASIEQTVQSASIVPVPRMSSTHSTAIHLVADDDYIHLTAVAMIKLQDRSTASVAVNIVTLVCRESGEIVRFSWFTHDILRLSRTN